MIFDVSCSVSVEVDAIPSECWRSLGGSVDSSLVMRPSVCSEDVGPGLVL